MSAQMELYHCPDSTPFPVAWLRPDDGTRLWVRDAAHWPAPLCPLEAALHERGWGSGARAFDEAELPMLPIVRQFYAPQGYMYVDPTPAPPEEQRHAEAAIDRLTARYGGVLGVWEGFALPRIQDAFRFLDAADERTPLPSLVDAWFVSLMLSMVAAQPAWLLRQRLHTLCAEALTDEGPLLAWDLLSGTENATLTANAAVWEAAQLAAASPAVQAHLLDPADEPSVAALGDVPGAAAFIAAVQRLLQRYGQRAESWNLLAPTWAEDPVRLLRLLRQLLVSPTPSPGDAVVAAAVRRDARMANVEVALGAAPDLRDRFRELRAETAGYVPVVEG